jgi:hypothetical protein
VCWKVREIVDFIGLWEVLAVYYNILLGVCLMCACASQEGGGVVIFANLWIGPEVSI